MSDSPQGGSFLLRPTSPERVFTPEDFNEEHRMIARSVSRFIDEKVLPVMDDLESQQEGVMVRLLRQAGELGLMGAEIPSEYDGTELDKISSTIICEEMGRAGAFAMTHGAQTGIGSLPIVFFGTDEQKSKYLPGIVSGEKIAAYALTEPGSGSDAMAAKTRASLSPDGKFYVLSGAKQFITNAGVADIFIVYAKVDGEKFSAFIVDSPSEGLSTGLEEKKMGIRGSSTRSVFLDDVKVPVENLLFEVGRGHIVAFNILNMGRYKLAANAVGNAKFALKISAGYANERVQFNVPIARFGLIGEKLAEMAIRSYAAESSVYRTGGLIDETLHDMDASGTEARRAAAGAMEKYAVECSINKVFATEVQSYVVDEGVQIHGGYGFISEYPIERLYRDARIYRIFEGTNEINRILIPTMLIRRSTSGGLPLLEAAETLTRRLDPENFPVPEDAEGLVRAAKELFLFTLGVGWQRCGEGLLKRQEILARLADLAIGAFAMESALLRAQKTMEKDARNGSRRKMNMAEAFIYTHFPKLGLLAREALSELAEGGELELLQARLAKFMQYAPINLIGLRRKIADEIVAAGQYVV